MASDAPTRKSPRLEAEASGRTSQISRRRRGEEHGDEERDVRGEPARPEQSGAGAVRREPERDARERQRRAAAPPAQ